MNEAGPLLRNLYNNVKASKWVKTGEGEQFVMTYAWDIVDAFTAIQLDLKTMKTNNDNIVTNGFAAQNVYYVVLFTEVVGNKKIFDVARDAKEGKLGTDLFTHLVSLEHDIQSMSKVFRNNSELHYDCHSENMVFNYITNPKTGNLELRAWLQNFKTTDPENHQSELYGTGEMVSFLYRAAQMALKMVDPNDADQRALIEMFAVKYEVPATIFSDFWKKVHDPNVDRQLASLHQFPEKAFKDSLYWMH